MHFAFIIIIRENANSNPPKYLCHAYIFQFEPISKAIAYRAHQAKSKSNLNPEKL